MAQVLSLAQQQVIARVRREGHDYVLRWLDELSESERDILLEQLYLLDFARVREVAALLAAGPKPPPLEDVAPAPVTRLPRSDEERDAQARTAALGAQALRDDRVAALTVAGGQGTRFNYKPPKGIYPITPVLRKSFFQVHAEKILAARHRYGCRIPWLIMVSPFNEPETRGFFEQHAYFGLGAQSVHFFAQPVNVILGADGRILMEVKCQALMGPDGHGGVFEALARTSILPELQEDGFDLISYFQVDNPLVTVADERFLGHHLAGQAEFSCKVIPKRDPWERLGVAVLRGGRPGIIEYSHLPDAMAAERLPSGELNYLYGSIAIHIMDVVFGRRVAEQRLSLPWHIARRQYDIVDDQGQQVKSDPKGCYKFERFVFDCMPYAERCAFVEVDRADEFAPVKTQEGADSPPTARAMMRAQWLRWLREAGADVTALEGPSAELEIGPLFATSAEELRERIPAGWRPVPPVVLDEPVARG